jgi:hypothetical protein
LREPFRVQESTKVTDLLSSFKTGRSHLACVYNKNGSLVKFVTLEDLFNLLIGEQKGGKNGGGKSGGGGKKDSNTTSAAAGDSNNNNNNGKSSDYPPTPHVFGSRNSNSLQAKDNNNHLTSKEVERAVLVASTFNVIRQSTAMAS